MTLLNYCLIKLLRLPNEVKVPRDSLLTPIVDKLLVYLSVPCNIKQSTSQFSLSGPIREKP